MGRFTVFPDQQEIATSRWVGSPTSRTSN